MRRITTLHAVLGVVLATAACGGSSSDDDDQAEAADSPAATAAPAGAGDAQPTATLPPAAGPSALDAKALLDRLPKAADIGPLELGIPTVAAIRDVAVEVGQDPKGPCGATLPLPTLDAATGRTYETVKGRIVAVALPRDEAVDAYVEANRSDLTAGCASHTTTAVDGTELTLSAPEPVDVAAAAPGAVAWISTIEQPNPGRRATVILESSDVAVVVTMNSAEPLDAALVGQIATIWAEKLAG